MLITIKDGWLQPQRTDIKDGTYEVKPKNMDTRTALQNRALHKYFGLLSEALNEQGLSVQVVLKVDVSWTPDAVKEYIWRPVQKAYTNKTSTTKINTTDIDKIYDFINAKLSGDYGIYVPFPEKDKQ